MKPPVSNNPPKPSLGAVKLFLGHAILVIIITLAALALPLYAITTSDGSAYSLYASGWVGDATVPWIFGIVPAQDYSSLIWSLLIAVGGAGILIAVAWHQRSATKSTWGALALVAIVPVLSACVLLASDNFPMAYATTTNLTLQITALAAWGVPLWGLATCSSLVVGGAVQQALTGTHSVENSSIHTSKGIGVTQDLEEIEFALLERARDSRQY